METKHAHVILGGILRVWYTIHYHYRNDKADV